MTRDPLTIPVFEQKPPGLGVVRIGRQFPTERVGEAIVRVEQERHVECVTIRFACDTLIEHGPVILRRQQFRRQRERLEQPERSAKPLVDRRRLIVGEYEPGGVVSKRCLRDRGVGVRSEDTLVEA